MSVVLDRFQVRTSPNVAYGKRRKVRRMRPLRSESSRSRAARLVARARRGGVA